ncbi:MULTISPECIES: IS982 family transposase [Streptomyces]|uniref:IS982 family transposase n=1 Tax=Streptomyces siderophoricus TaxID=2802281 RepID=A0ABS1N4S8_9ACTN|nr:IS982 family transposase [Streptomyces sp. 9-7]MBL1095063.1 IS982 family transposase [Streptomyces sp. 9-7]
MTSDLDALLAALYVFIDDRVAPCRRIGRPPKLTDAELLCLAIAQVLLGFPSARHWIRFAHARLGHLFRYLPQQSAYNKRLNAAGPLISQVIEALASQVPTWHDDLRLIDSTPLPCAASRETVKRSDLAGHAGYGYCRSHSRFFWGLRLYLLTTAEGMPVSWCLANPKLGEREVMTALLERDHHLVRTGQVILADKGFAGREFKAFLAERLGVHLVRPDRKGEPVRHGRLARVRQWIEAVFDTLKGQLSLEQHGARTPAGVFARTGQRLLALAAAIWHNWTTGAKIKRSLIAYDH